MIYACAKQLQTTKDTVTTRMTWNFIWDIEKDSFMQVILKLSNFIVRENFTTLIILPKEMFSEKSLPCTLFLEVALLTYMDWQAMLPTMEVDCEGRHPTHFLKNPTFNAQNFNEKSYRTVKLTVLNRQYINRIKTMFAYITGIGQRADIIKTIIFLL